MTVETELINEERKRTSFSVEELTNIFDGGEEQTEVRRKVESVFINDPELKPHLTCHMSREELYTDSMRRTVYVYKKLLLDQGWSPTSAEMIYVQRSMGDHSLPIHVGAFTPSLLAFCSEEQLAKWLPLALGLKIIGTYAQTELGHGTFLRGLETVATYDRSTEEFVVNCPQISSMKWWPGDMGKNANHVLVMANLKIDDVSHGMHPFIVQIRDLTTHQPLPGVTVGDIGPKMGFEAVDNGFLFLQNVRIPRENLLCKNAQVSADGIYKKTRSDRLMYGSMVTLRVGLQKISAILPLAKVMTIAVRYSAVRRQGRIDPGKPEVPVLNYVTQQHKLLPGVATVYCSMFAVGELQRKYKTFQANMRSGDISGLPELHALSAGMKSFVTEQCCAVAETARRACGGHGYSNLSGITMITRQMLASVTYEGENTVMYLQCARYLAKFANASKPPVVDETVAYLWSPDQVFSVRMPQEFKYLDVLLACFHQRAKHAVKQSVAIFEGYLKTQPRHAAWNQASVQLVRAARIHIQQSIITTSFNKIKHLICSPAVKEVLYQLAALYALHQLNNEAGDFVKYGVLDPTLCQFADRAETELLSQLRPNSVALVDAFDIHDDFLQSCLGCYDGNVYERMFEAAKKAPMNRSQVHEATYKYLKPFLHQGRDILEGSKLSKL